MYRARGYKYMVGVIREDTALDGRSPTGTHYLSDGPISDTSVNCQPG